MTGAKLEGILIVRIETAGSISCLATAIAPASPIAITIEASISRMGDEALVVPRRGRSRRERPTHKPPLADRTNGAKSEATARTPTIITAAGATVRCSPLTATMRIIAANARSGSTRTSTFGGKTVNRQRRFVETGDGKSSKNRLPNLSLRRRTPARARRTQPRSEPTIARTARPAAAVAPRSLM